MKYGLRLSAKNPGSSQRPMVIFNEPEMISGTDVWDSFPADEFPDNPQGLHWEKCGSRTLQLKYGLIKVKFRFLPRHDVPWKELKKGSEADFVRQLKSSMCDDSKKIIRIHVDLTVPVTVLQDFLIIDQ